MVFFVRNLSQGESEHDRATGRLNESHILSQSRDQDYGILIAESGMASQGREATSIAQHRREWKHGR